MQSETKEIRLSGHMSISVQTEALAAMKGLAREEGGGGIVMLVSFASSDAPLSLAFIRDAKLTRLKCGEC